MNKIFKYPIDVKGLQEVEFPQGARILAVQVQKSTGGFMGPLENETVCLWAMSNTEESKTVRRMFRIFGTGKTIDEPLDDLDYIGTVQTRPFVWHIFERKGPK